MPDKQDKMNKPQSEKQAMQNTDNTQNASAQMDGFRYDYNDSSDFTNYKNTRR